jgi:hypothetical protein
MLFDSERDVSRLEGEGIGKQLSLAVHGKRVKQHEESRRRLGEVH